VRARLRTLLFGLAVGAAMAGPAAAEDQLVMPFACRVAGGTVSLAPSAPQTYPIYGRAEHKRLTTCSPYDPGKCHNWSVHRFDLDCGGVRTSWQSVVAALSPMLAESAGEAYGDDARAPQAMAGRYQPGPAGRIAFPPGFAPNPMKVAQFKHTEDVAAPVPLPPKKPAAAPADVAELQPGPTPPAAPVPTDGKAEAAAETEAAQAPAKPVAQRALNIEIESGTGEVTGALPEQGSLWRDAGLVFAVTLTALLALSVLLLLRRGGRLALPRPMTVLRLRGPAGLPALRRSLVSEWKDAAGRLTGGKAQSGLRLWDEDWLPATKREARDVLGVDPRAGRDTIKSTVTRLRRALHPDYALDEEDRLLRERRLKQINAAWEILGGKRRAPWLRPAPRSA
jgi:DnaJ-like protein